MTISTVVYNIIVITRSGTALTDKPARFKLKPTISTAWLCRKNNFNYIVIDFYQFLNVISDYTILKHIGLNWPQKE